MIHTVFSKLKTVPYSVKELQNMSYSDRKIMIDFNYEKTIGIEKITEVDLQNIDEVRQKVLNLCEKSNSQSFILIMTNYSNLGEYVVNDLYNEDDSNAIFESMLYKNEEDKIIEVVRVFGKNLNNVLRTISEYGKIHELPSKLNWKTNLRNENLPMKYPNT